MQAAEAENRLGRKIGSNLHTRQPHDSHKGRLVFTAAPLLAMLIRIASALMVAGLLAAAPAAHAQTKKTTKKTVTKKAPVKTTTKTTTKVVVPPPAPVAPLTEAEANSGLKDALTKGVTKAVQYASEPDGFNLNDDIRIPFPEDAIMMKTVLSKLPGSRTLIETFETQLNRAAEAAAPQAKDIFVNALANISFTDALSLVTNSSPDAATQFLKKQTYAQLASAFHPSIEAAIDQVGAGKAYAQMTSQYNRIPLMTPVQTNLADYTTNKTVDGIFFLLAKEEGKIRKNPAARTTDLMKRVFGMAK